jgi:hypothetical protein
MGMLSILLFLPLKSMFHVMLIHPHVQSITKLREMDSTAFVIIIIIIIIVIQHQKWFKITPFFYF